MPEPLIDHVETDQERDDALMFVHWALINRADRIEQLRAELVVRS